MSELARRRSARDLWISRGHLYAMGTGAAFAVLAAFAAGYVTGRGSVEAGLPSAQRYAGDAGDVALVELLARVDATATPDGGVLELTFPDALAGRAVEAPAIEPVPPAPEGAEVPPVAVELPEAGDTPPPGRWTVAAVATDARVDADRVAADLRSREVEAWVGVEQVDGQARYRVSVGGWGSRTEAEGALSRLAPVIEAVGGQADVVRY